MASSSSMAGIPSRMGYASLLVGQTMSCRASAEDTGARGTGQASISMSRVSMPGSYVFSGRRGAGARDQPAQRDGDRHAHRLLGAGPLRDASIHGGDPD